MGRYKLNRAKVRTLLLRNLLTLQKLSELAGIAYGTACSACGPKNKPVTMPTLKKICQALSCQASDIVTL